MIKGGARQETIFDTVKMLTEKGLTIKEAIEEIESVLHGKLPDRVISLIYQECN